MYFKNENTVFEICVAGYTDEPDYYGGVIGRNALDCQFTWCRGTEWIGTLWDALFQTDDIVRLYEGVTAVLEGAEYIFEYADKLDYVKMKLVKAAESYELSVSVYHRGDGEYITDAFVLSKERLEEFAKELFDLKNAFPVVE